MALTWISTTGDWSSGASWSTGTAPVSTDDVFFVDNGAVSVSSGLSQGAVDLASLNVVDFPSDIATSASPLIIGATAYRLTGSGAVYIQNDSASTETVWVAGTHRDAALRMTGSAVSRMVILRGGVEIVCAVTALQVGHVDNYQRDAVVTINGVAVATLYQSAGHVATTGGASIGDCYRSGGTIDFQGSAAAAMNLINGGGTFKYQATNTLSPNNLSTIVVGKGLVDLSEPYISYNVGKVYVLGRAQYKKHASVVTTSSEYNVNTEVAYGPQP